MGDEGGIPFVTKLPGFDSGLSTAWSADSVNWTKTNPSSTKLGSTNPLEAYAKLVQQKN